MNKSDKRGAPRVPYISEVVCEGAGTRLIARTIDLSATGVFVHSKLCCEAGLILKLRFSVGATEIETTGEVCYSMAQIGMGVRFLDLKHEYRIVIERLIEDQRAHAESENVEAQGRTIIPSGVQPIDKLLGGLDRSQMYLAHGDASGKSLFGSEFLIEGLKSAHTSALISPYSMDSAVRRFARLGYDCSEDIRGRRLLTVKYPLNIAEKVFQHGHLAPLLRELEPILDESSPMRIVFDPVNNLLAGEMRDDIVARVSEFAVWVRSFGATVVLVANGENGDVIECLRHSVKESFRFGVRETSDRIVRFIAFEKSRSIPDQSVRVDPSRGISLLENQQSLEPANEGAEMMPKTADGLDDRSNSSEEQHGAFFAMLDELQSYASSLEPDVAETEKHHPSALGS